MSTISDKQVSKLASLLVGLQDLVESLKSQQVTLTSAQAERIEKFRREGRCLYCQQSIVEGESRRRGCHHACNNLVQNMINRGKLTWQGAVDNGWINPIAEKPGRKSSRPDPSRSLHLKSNLAEKAMRSELAKGQPKPKKRKEIGSKDGSDKP